MRAQDLAALEFETVLTEVARHAASAAGREACLDLRPRSGLAAVREEIARVGDLLALLSEYGSPLSGNFPDIRPHLTEARTIGARLAATDLLEIAHVLVVTRDVEAYLRKHAAGRPLLRRSLDRLHALPDLDARLGAALDEDGGLRDDASPALRSIRRELRSLRTEIEARLSRLFRGSAADRVFADQYVTVRNGRFVVPVRAQSQSSVAGIVQDRSSSGETLFVEPLFAVEPNNRLTIAAREEAEEEARILAELTRLVGTMADALDESFASLVDLDTVAARARFALHHEGTCPDIAEPGAGGLLRRARHPLLVLTGRPVTPIDLELDPDRRLLILTGPNTGGKSVGLKTLGLAALMAQSGIPILAEAGAQLPLFDGVWTDIGDQQNVADDLSTFSGHVRNLAEVLAAAGSASLVLLDEPGTGTDPEDGAALARVLLEALMERGTRVLATTHFQAVKVFALESERASVATVDFDPETFSPRYRLVYGNIGPSLGLAMARRLGFPETLLTHAETERGTLAQRLGTAVERLESARRRYEDEAGALDAERARLRKRENESEALLAELRDKKKRRWADELGEAKRFAEELRSEGRRLLAEARRDPAKMARRLHQAGVDQAARVERRREELRDDRPHPESRPDTTLAPGDEVEILDNGLRGTLVSLAGARAQVARGNVRFDVPAGRLRRVAAATQPRPARTTPHGLRRTPSAPEGAGPAHEINLVGKRVGRALEELETFLDRAALDDRSVVRIVHGHGSGALRRAVREYLADCAYVARYEEADPHAGGSGATIAHLR